MKVIVNDLYNYAVHNNVCLLSEYDSDFWREYILLNDNFDRLFKRLFKSFIYESDSNTIAEIFTDFVNDVNDILLEKDKMLNELWRVKVLPSTAYDLVNNYDMTETLNENNHHVDNGRNDSTTSTTGAQSNEVTNKVSPYDSVNFNNESSVNNNIGERHDSISMAYGQQITDDTNSHTLTRKGNIGVMTATDVMSKHVDFWSMFDFYDYVFKIIARELLCVGGD